MWLNLALYVVAINAVTFAAFALDKRQAEARAWRVQERTLLQLALIGGAPAAISAQQLLRHKTRKEPLRTQLWVIALVQAAALVSAAVWFSRGGG